MADDYRDLPPQAWINDVVVEVDPLGATTFDVTPEVTALGREKALALKDDSYQSDTRRGAKAAPEWVRDWPGPSWVEIEASIAEHLGSGR